MRLCPFISEADLRWGYTDIDVCIVNSKKGVDSSSASCGNSADEEAIRCIVNEQIEESQSAEGFAKVDRAVELIRLLYLVLYPTEKIEFNKTRARDKIRNAVENIISRLRLPDNDQQLTTLDSFTEQLSTNTGLKQIQIP